ncbi:MAG: nuclear transport factor 2 family protein [Gemmatimonadota bacterium]
MRRAVVASLVAAAVLIPARARAQATDPQSEVMAVVQRLFDGMRAGDSSVVRSVFHPQTRMMTAARGPDGKLRLRIDPGIDGFVKAIGTPRPAPLDERIWNPKVEIDGPLASVWVDYALYVGDKFSHCGIDHFLLVRGDDAAWTIVSIADTRRTEGCKP